MSAEGGGVQKRDGRRRSLLLLLMLVRIFLMFLSREDEGCGGYVRVRDVVDVCLSVSLLEKNVLLPAT